MKPISALLLLLSLPSNEVVVAIQRQQQRLFVEESKRSRLDAIKSIELSENVDSGRKKDEEKVATFRETNKRIATHKYKMKKPNSTTSTTPTPTIPARKKSLQREPTISKELPIIVPVSSECDDEFNCVTRTLVIKTIDIDYVEVEEEVTELDLNYDFDVSSSTRLVVSVSIAAGIIFGVVFTL